MPFKPIESFPSGGVDSRSNPTAMPTDAFLSLVNFWPQQDGSMQLRDGYAFLASGLAGVGTPLYSIQPITGPGPTFKRLIAFWQNKVPFYLDPGTGAEVSPTVKGTPIASGARFVYFYTNGHLHAFNGTDAKWFDGFVWRDIGLPTLTPAQVSSIVVSEGLSGITPSQGASTTLAFSSGGAWKGKGPSNGDLYGRCFYFALFNPSTNEVSPATLLGSGAISGAVNQQLGISTLPAVPTGRLGLIAMTDDDGGVGTNAYFEAQGTNIVTGSSATITTAPGNLVTIFQASGGFGSFSAGHVIELFYPDGFGGSQVIGPVTLLSASATTLTFTGPFSLSHIGVLRIWRLQTIAAGATTGSISGTTQYAPPVAFYATPVGVTAAFVANTSGIAASAVGGAQPGYQFYASIYNLTTGHVGNRTAIGPRLAPTAPVNFVLSGLPVFSDSEWVLLIGRTSDGAEIPYAVVDANANWIAAANGATSLTISQSNIDGNSELPSRNFPPPGTLDFNYQLSLLPGGAAQNPPITGTFIKAWVESDHCCGVLTGSPTIYRSGSALDLREGVFVGLPEQSWDPADIETFPTAGPITSGQGYQQESWVYTLDDCAVLLELAGETQWQGPWNIGGAGQYSWARGWQNLPYWLTGEKQIATISSGGYQQMGGMTTSSIPGPVVISDEYEAYLLDRIGDQYLSEVEFAYIKKPAQRIEVLRISCRDALGNPFTIIHDFGLRDSQSPYGKAYEEDFSGPLGSPYTMAYVRDENGKGQIVAGDSVGNLYLLYFTGVATFLSGPIAAGTIPQNIALSSLRGIFVGQKLSIDTGSNSEVVTVLAIVGNQIQAIFSKNHSTNAVVMGGTTDAGTEFTATGLKLINIGPNRTAVQYLEWYGDQTVQWYLAAALDTPFDVTKMIPLNGAGGDNSEVKSVVEQGQGHNSHWVVPIGNPELVHAYLVCQLASHSADGTTQLNSPPHIPLESYGRIWLAAPLLGTSKGK